MKAFSILLALPAFILPALASPVDTMNAVDAVDAADAVEVAAREEDVKVKNDVRVNAVAKLLVNVKELDASISKLSSIQREPIPACLTLAHRHHHLHRNQSLHQSREEKSRESRHRRCRKIDL